MTFDELKKDRRYWQRLLRSAGLYTGKIDGIRGPLQRAAEAAWETQVACCASELGRFDSRSEGNIATLLPAAQRVARMWLGFAREEARELGVQVRIICGTRTYAAQDALYAQGRTRAGARVTNARGGYSWHNFGLAWDFGVFTADGKGYLGDGPQYRVLGKVAYKVPGLEWGGDWASFPDFPHLQLRKFASVAEARADF